MQKVSILAATSLALLSSIAHSHVSITETKTTQNFSFSVEDIKLDNKIIEGQNFQVANLVGVDGFAGVRHDVGAPEIPVIRFYVQANKASDIKITTDQAKAARSFSISTELKPVMDSVEKIPGATYQFNKDLGYRGLKNYPDMSYQIENAGSLRGQKQFMVTLYPVEFSGSANALRIARQFNVEVKKPVMKAQNAMDGFVFVVPAKFKTSASLANYMAVKADQGFEVSRIDLPAGATADLIRTRLKSLYSQKTNLKYALILGEATDAPGRTSTTIAGLTDHYFSAIDTSSYESDINGPDLMVGRIAVANETQLSAVLRKYTRYIKGEFTNMNWLSNVSFLATDDRYEVAEGTHNYVIDSYTKSLGYQGIFPAQNQAGGDKLYAITHHAVTTDVMKSLLQGRSIVDYSGHGATTFWDAPNVTQSNVRSLNSSSSLPFVISNACITGDYRVDESFAETWQRHEWGAVMFWGSMDSTYWDEDDILEKRMFDGIFKGGLKTFGAITTNALLEHWKFYGGAGKASYYWETYHMFGDPSITLRLK